MPLEAKGTAPGGAEEERMWDMTLLRGNSVRGPLIASQRDTELTGNEPDPALPPEDWRAVAEFINWMYDEWTNYSEVPTLPRRNLLSAYVESRRGVSRDTPSS